MASTAQRERNVVKPHPPDHRCHSVLGFTEGAQFGLQYRSAIVGNLITSEALIRLREQHGLTFRKIRQRRKRGTGSGFPTRQHCWSENGGLNQRLQAITPRGKAKRAQRVHNFRDILACIHASTSSVATTLTSGLVKA